MSRKLQAGSAIGLVLALIVGIWSVGLGPFQSNPAPAKTSASASPYPTESAEAELSAEKIQDSIQKYLGTPSQSEPASAFKRLTLRIPAGFSLTSAGGEGPPSYEMMCGVTLGGQSGCPKLSIYDFKRAPKNKRDWRTWGWKDECGAAKPKRQKGSAQIGGKPATVSVAGHCLFWEVNGMLLYTTHARGSNLAKVARRAVTSARWN